eukprot:537965-Pleurochrysis_carterae.AAC.1
MASALCILLASLLALIAYMGIMHFFFEGEAAVAILPYLALAIAAIVYSSLRDPFMLLREAPSGRSAWSSSSFGFPALLQLCSTCYGQLPNCLGGAKCPLAVFPVQHAAILAGSAAAAIKGAYLLPLRVLRAFTQNVICVLKTIVMRVAL